MQPVMATAARQVIPGNWLQKGVWLAEGGLAMVGGDWLSLSPS